MKGFEQIGEEDFMANVFPQQFGPYTLHQLVGRGGMAEIYRATMPGIGSFEKVLAIKKILPHLVENEEYITMLTDEARLVVGLNHANIAQVYDLGRIDESYYIAMEYVHGVDIALIIKDAQKKQRPIPYEHVAYMMSGLCMGLHVAHHATGRDGEPLDIIHRDISPHNVLISFAGDVKVIDFGVAKASSKEGQTQVGVIKGKLLYMAPEQAMAKDIDGRADLFAAGLVMYKMLTWELPFQGDNEFQIYNNILTKEIVPPQRINPQVPDELNRICMTLLQRDVDMRYQDGYAAKRDLERTLHHIAPGYTPSRLSRFIEENFLEQVQERLARQNSKTGQQAAVKASARVKEPVRQSAAHTSQNQDLNFSPASTPSPAPHRQSTVNPGFGPTPVPSDISPMTPRGFHTPRHQTPAKGYDVASHPDAFHRTQDQNNLSTGHIDAPADLSTPLPTPKKKSIPAILIAVILLGVLFLGMGLYVFLSTGRDSVVAPTTPEVPATSGADTRSPLIAQEPVLNTPPLIEEPVEEPIEAPAPLTFTISTEPAGAIIFLDGARHGIAPLNIDFAAEDSSRSVRASLADYEDQEFELTRQSDLTHLIVLIKKEDEKVVTPRSSDTKKTRKDPTPQRKDREPPQDKPALKDTDRPKGFDIFGTKNKKQDKEKVKKSDDPKESGEKKVDKALEGWN